MISPPRKIAVVQVSFDASDERHERLAELSACAHALVRNEDDESREALRNIEVEIDETAAEIWNISDAELRDIEFSLADVRGRRLRR